LVFEGDPDPITGLVKATQHGNAEDLLDAAFRAVLTVEAAMTSLRSLFS
jgi:hypothetical protein